MKNDDISTCRVKTQATQTDEKNNETNNKISTEGEKYLNPPSDNITNVKAIILLTTDKTEVRKLIDKIKNI
uniref:Uncharacterized protein n=1 Tax=Strongyloides stercoralis TaxID=6248 RepID=A0A0K0EC64_STRER